MLTPSSAAPGPSGHLPSSLFQPCFSPWAEGRMLPVKQPLDHLQPTPPLGLGPALPPCLPLGPCLGSLFPPSPLLHTSGITAQGQLPRCPLDPLQWPSELWPLTMPGGWRPGARLSQPVLSPPLRSGLSLLLPPLLHGTKVASFSGHRRFQFRPPLPSPGLVTFISSCQASLPGSQAPAWCSSLSLPGGARSSASAHSCLSAAPGSVPCRYCPTDTSFHLHKPHAVDELTRLRDRKMCPRDKKPGWEIGRAHV